MVHQEQGVIIVEKDKFFLTIDDLFFNILITLKEQNIETTFVSYKELEEYGEMLVESALKENIYLYLLLSRDRTIRFYNDYCKYVYEDVVDNHKGIRLKDYLTKEDLIELSRGWMPLRVLLIFIDEDFQKSVADKYRSNHDKVERKRC